MKKVEIDGSIIKNNRILHMYLRYAFNLPSYYGENLDALYDILSSTDKSYLIELNNKASLINNLGDYGIALIETIEDCASDNDNIKFIEV